MADIMELNKITMTSGDETSGYEITFKKECTLREVIGEILSKTKEWGVIHVKSAVFGFSLEYRYGNLLTDISLFQGGLDYSIIRGTALGGWSRMDYIFVIAKK